MSKKTINSPNQYNQYGYVPVYVDGSFVGTTGGESGCTYWLSYGDHQFEMPWHFYDGYDHFFSFFYYNDIFDFNNPTTISITSDKTLYANYLSLY